MDEAGLDCIHRKYVFAYAEVELKTDVDTRRS